MDVTGGVVVLLIASAVLVGSRLTRREPKQKAPRQPHQNAPERCIIQVGRALIDELSAGETSPFLTALPLLRLRWIERGLHFPPTRFFDTARLEPDQYVFRLDGRTVLDARLQSGRVLLLAGQDKEALPPGKEATYEGLPAVWVDPETAAREEANGFLPLQARDVFLGQISTTARRELHHLGRWRQFFRNPTETQEERFREHVIAKLEEGETLHPIDYAAFWFETHDSLADYQAPDEQGTNELTAALIYQNLGQVLKQSINQKLSSPHLERLGQALLEIWELDEDAREHIMRRARVWNLQDNDQAVDAVVKLLVHCTDYDQQDNPRRRLALLLSSLHYPVRSGVLNQLASVLTKDELAELTCELAAVQTACFLNEHALTDPLERERYRVVREFVEWRRHLLRPRVVNVWPGQCEQMVAREPRVVAVWLRHIWFFDDPLERLQRFAATEANLAKMFWHFSKKRPSATLTGPQKIGILLECLSEKTARKLRREMSQLTLPPVSPPEVSEAERLLVCEELAYRMRRLSNFRAGEH